MPNSFRPLRGVRILFASAALLVLAPVASAEPSHRRAKTPEATKAEPLAESPDKSEDPLDGIELDTPLDRGKKKPRRPNQAPAPKPNKNGNSKAS
jgi:hypothetical protein